MLYCNLVLIICMKRVLFTSSGDVEYKRVQLCILWPKILGKDYEQGVVPRNYRHAVWSLFSYYVPDFWVCEALLLD